MSEKYSEQIMRSQKLICYLTLVSYGCNTNLWTWDTSTFIIQHIKWYAAVTISTAWKWKQYIVLNFDSWSSLKATQNWVSISVLNAIIVTTLGIKSCKFSVALSSKIMISFLRCSVSCPFQWSTSLNCDILKRPRSFSFNL